MWRLLLVFIFFILFFHEVWKVKCLEIEIFLIITCINIDQMLWLSYIMIVKNDFCMNP